MTDLKSIRVRARTKTTQTRSLQSRRTPYQLRPRLHRTSTKLRLNVDVDTEKSPHTDVSLNDSPYVDQGPNNFTHLDGGVNEIRQTNHDDPEDQPRFENRSIEDNYIHTYWTKEYAGHVWNDNCGWRVINPGSAPEPWWIEDPPPMSPSDPDYLCDVCRHIDFGWLFENDMPKLRCEVQGHIRIGTVERVLKQANCSFCELLASSFPEWVLEYEVSTVHIESTCFSESPDLDYNHPETEAKYLTIHTGPWTMDLQVLDSRPMRGRQISPYIKQQSIARQWLEKCEHEHFGGENEVLDFDLALIDLNQRCIVRPHGPVRYAALSYVWGESEQKMYSTSTRQEFETMGTLHSNQGFLTQTITDAMDLAAHIGLDYLWVDSLCILQDDEADRGFLISRMGSIYGASAITIVDANGQTARGGLTGMSYPRKTHRRIAIVQGMQLCTTVSLFGSPFHQNWTCAWLQRGWTYQEMLLSKRLLLVTRRQLAFVCNHTVYLEESHPHSPRTRDWTLPATSGVQIRRSSVFRTPISCLYHNAVEMFTSRVLKYDMDVVPAFDAIFKALYKNTEAKSLFNLPDIDIEEALLWESCPMFYYPPLTSSEHMSRTTRRRHPDHMPTWSWAGWRGEIQYRYPATPSTPPISAVSWLCAPTSSVNERSQLTPQDYRCADWKEKGWKHRYLPDWDNYVYTHVSRPDSFFWHPIALEPRAGLHKPSFLDDSNVLHFLAFAVHISTSAIIHGLQLDNRETRLRRVFESCRYRAGFIGLDCFPSHNADLRLVALARCSDKSIEQCVRQLRVDLRKIAPLDWDPEYFKNISQPNAIDKPSEMSGLYDHWDRGRFRDKFYPLYSTLLVEMREGISYRIGIGKVHIDAFHAANPVWEEVQLG